MAKITAWFRRMRWAVEHPCGYPSMHLHQEVEWQVIPISAPFAPYTPGHPCQCVVLIVCSRCQWSETT